MDNKYIFVILFLLSAKFSPYFVRPSASGFISCTFIENWCLKRCWFVGPITQNRRGHGHTQPELGLHAEGPCRGFRWWENAWTGHTDGQLCHLLPSARQPDRGGIWIQPVVVQLPHGSGLLFVWLPSICCSFSLARTAFLICSAQEVDIFRSLISIF